MPNVTGGKTTDGANVEIVEVGGVPEMFCDRIVVRTFGETVRIYLCRAMAPDGGKAEVIAIAHMPVGSYVESLGHMANQRVSKRKPDGH